MRNKQLATYAGVATGALLLIIIVALAAGGPVEEPIDLPPRPEHDPQEQALREQLETAFERLRVVSIEQIPEALAMFPDERMLSPALADRVAEAKAVALARFDARAEALLNALLAARVKDDRSKEQTLEDLRKLRVTFAISRKRPQIEDAITALEIEHVTRSSKPAAPSRPIEPPSTHREYGSIDLIGPGRLKGWRKYGDWASEGGVLTFNYDDGAKYSNTIQSALGVGECKLSAEVKMSGGGRATVALWEQGTEDRESGAPDSSVAVSVAGEDLEPASREWTRLEIVALADEVTATFGGKPLRSKANGPLRNGRVGISLEGGEWTIRSLDVTPLLVKGDPAYEVVFEDGGGREWIGKRLSSGLQAVKRPSSRDKWLELLGGQDVFDITDGMRLGFAYRADHVVALIARVMITGGEIYRFRLSGQPPRKKWTALTVPLSDFRNEEGASPPIGATVRSIGVGARGPEDASLIVSVLRLVP
jgi:hypothetical protein